MPHRWSPIAASSLAARTAGREGRRRWEKNAATAVVVAPRLPNRANTVKQSRVSAPQAGRCKACCQAAGCLVQTEPRLGYCWIVTAAWSTTPQERGCGPSQGRPPLTLLVWALKKLHIAAWHSLRTEWCCVADRLRFSLTVAARARSMHRRTLRNGEKVVKAAHQKGIRPGRPSRTQCPWLLSERRSSNVAYRATGLTACQSSTMQRGLDTPRWPAETHPPARGTTLVQCRTTAERGEAQRTPPVGLGADIVRRHVLRACRYDA